MTLCRRFMGSSKNSKFKACDWDKSGVYWCKWAFCRGSV